VSLLGILILVFVLVLLFGGGGYYGSTVGWRPAYYGGFGLGSLLLVLLVLYLLGVFR
jgi:hypothetical protein